MSGKRTGTREPVFRDECFVTVQAGKGGDGLVSFRREKYVPKGGPNGGDGGDGGDVVLVASSSVSSLLGIARRPLYRARGGGPGGPVNRTGAKADDLVIEVPVGTQVFDRERGHLLRDLGQEGERVVVAQGGRGGRGNASFANSVRQAPRIAQDGAPGEHRELHLVLKIFAEVGLVGLPNAGKSTFLSVVTRATPKIADYPFTTLEPQIGIAAVGDGYDSLVIADLPGLIEGAAEGSGLGHRFLQHVERCRVLLHLVDVSSTAEVEPERAVAVIARELAEYSPELASRPRLVVATKCEDDEARRRARELAAATGRPVHEISAIEGSGVPELLVAARELVRAD